MALLAPVSIPAVELYLLRFVLRKNAQQILFCTLKYAPLVELAEMGWSKVKGQRIIVSSDTPEVIKLTSAHFNLIQANAAGWTQLFVWYPAVKPFDDSNEVRLLQRAGIDIQLLGRTTRMRIR